MIVHRGLASPKSAKKLQAALDGMGGFVSKQKAAVQRKGSLKQIAQGRLNEWKDDRKVAGDWKKENERLSELGPAGRTDPLRSLKLGLDPSGPAITDLYEFNEVLGKGFFGSVQKVTHLETSKHYACKLLKTVQVENKNLKSEIRVLKECQHPNIIFLKEAFATEEYIYLVMELAKGGELFDWIMKECRIAPSHTHRLLCFVLVFPHPSPPVFVRVSPSALWPRRVAISSRDHMGLGSERAGARFCPHRRLLLELGPFTPLAAGSC